MLVKSVDLLCDIIMWIIIIIVFIFEKKDVQWGAFYLFIANFFATQIKGGAKEIVDLL
jgi:hypothetical protein